MQWHYGFVTSVLCALSVCTPTLAQGQPFFLPLGDLPGGGFASYAIAVSKDGSTVGGFSEAVEGAWHTFVWTREIGMRSLGGYPDPVNSLSIVYAINQDGSVMVGRYMPGPSQAPYYSMKWNEKSGMRALFGEEAPDTSHSAEALTSSGQESVFLYFHFDGSLPRINYIWRDAEHYDTIPFTGLYWLYGIGLAISGDGAYVAGTATCRCLGSERAFRWTRALGADGMLDLGELPGGYSSSTATAMSTDGSTVVGWSQSANGIEAFRWREDTGILGLGDIGPSRFYSYATCANGDGSIVVGRSAGPFIWNAEHGMRSLHTLAEQEYGIDIPELWGLTDPEAISDDGRTIVGWGINPQGQDEAWVLYLGPACPADWDNSHILDSNDFFAYIVDFFAGQGDVNHDAHTTAADFFEYLTAFMIGCER